MDPSCVTELGLPYKDRNHSKHLACQASVCLKGPGTTEAYPWGLQVRQRMGPAAESSAGP